MYPFHNNSGLMNWQYYQNGHIPYSAPFQPMGNQSYDMTSIMQYNAWQSQMNRYSPLDSFTTHTTKVLADAINQGAEIHNQVSTDVNTWCDTNKSLESTTLSPEPEISLTNCEVTSPNEVCSEESPWHSTVKHTLPAISPSVTQINDPIQLSPISGEKSLLVSPDNITNDEWIDWAKSKLAYTDKDEVSEWSSNLDICLPDLNEREPTTETLEHTSENNTIFDDTNVDILNFNQNESVKINDDCKESSEELLIEENIERDRSNNSKESEILHSENNTIEKMNADINCSDNSKVLEIASSENTTTENTTTENMNAEINSSNNLKDSEISPTENNAIKKINDGMNGSNITKELEISPYEYTSIENMDVKSDRSDVLIFNQNESVKINEDCKEMSEELLIEKNVQIDNSNNLKESEILPSENNTIEKINAEIKCSNNSKVLEISSSENTTTENMNSESNSSKDSEISPSENTAGIMNPFHNNSGLMNWQYYQNGQIPYSAPFQSMGNQSYDMTSIMQYNAWQSQMNRYSPLDSFTTHTTKVLADANMNAESNSSNNLKDSEISPTENNAIEKINDEMNGSNITKELEISPSENTSIENMDVESDRFDVLNFNQNESVKINEDCKEMSEELLMEKNVQIDNSNNLKESEILPSENNTIEKINAEIKCSNNSKLLEISSTENTTTENMNSESNSSNNSKDSEISSSENTVIETMDIESNGSSSLKEIEISPSKNTTIENINGQLNGSNNSKELEISPSENTTIEKMDVESNGSCNLKNNVISISENTTAEHKNIVSVGVNILKEFNISLTENNTNEIRNETHNSFKFLEESSMNTNTTVGYTIKSENSMNSVFGGHDSHRRDTLRLRLKKTCTGIWVVKNSLNENRLENNDYGNIEMYGNEKTNESYCKWEIPSQLLECKLECKLEDDCDIKPFKCKKCYKVFNLKTSLNNHMLTHSNIKPFVCSFCGKAFKLKNTLNTHILGQHTNERPFKCNLCSKGFYQKGALKSHSLTHTGEKPFKCEICEKGFTQSGSLKIHMRTHSGEKKLFICPFCNKDFSLKRTMKAHMKSHNMENEI